MAELVQLHIERTISELEQMERIGLFTKDEIKKMIKKRRALEYTLRRRKKSKEDFLKYIQYELNVLSLIGKRRERLQCFLKRQEIDHAIATRINKLFKTVILRYQGDVSLWMSQIEFCKRMKWHHSISGLFARMLQVHSNNAALWATAAKWEIEENNAPENARHLLQRGLRHHPKSRDLWLEYFQMELMYTDIVWKRREVLGVQGVKPEQIEENDAVLDGSIAMVVYKNAVAAIPDAEFALSFIPVCQQFKFTDKHIDAIFEDVQGRCPDQEETLDALARRPLLRLKEEIKEAEQRGEKRKDVIWNTSEKVCQAFEEALEKVPTVKMWKFYIDFCLQRLKSVKKEKRKAKLRSELVHIMERASSVDCLDYDHYVEWIRLLISCGEEENAASTSLEAARKWPEKVSMWHMCISLHIEVKKGSPMISSIFNEALASVKEKESYPIWQLGVQWLSLTKPWKLKDLLEQGIQGCREVSIPLKELYLEVSALQGDIQATRDLYKRLVHVPPLSSNVYKKMIQIENAQLKPSIEWLRKCFQDAVREYGSTDVDLWLDFIKLEVEHPDGNPSLYSMLHWRAMRCLEAEYIDEFTTRATLYSTGRGSDSHMQSTS